MLENPFEASDTTNTNDYKNHDWIELLLGMGTFFCGTLLLLGATLEIFLISHYPRLRDDLSGPTYYWPMDAFQIVGGFCFLVFCLFAVTFGLFILRKRKRRR